MDFDALISLYQEPRFWYIPFATLAISIGAFLLFALPWTLLAYLDPKPMQKYKIQQRPFQVEKYFWPCIARITINSSIMLVLLFMTWPILRLSSIHLGETPPWYLWIAQVVFFIVMDDFLYYWMHRAFHTRWLLKNVHSVHHRIRNTSAIDGNYFNWLEFVLTGALALVGPVLLGVHAYVLWSWIIIRQLEAADGHSGYDIPWNPTHWLPVYQGPVYHDFHHARFKGNYAGFLPYLDRFWGTYIPEYLTYISAKKKNNPNKKEPKKEPKKETFTKETSLPITSRPQP